MFKSLIVLFFATIPVIGWMSWLLKKHKKNKILILLTFIGGIFSAFLIIYYQKYWDQTINLIFFKVNPINFKENINGIFNKSPLLALFLSFVGVGVIEEFMKFQIMRLINLKFFKSIDDVIELAIVSALGFAFLENIVYFSHNWEQLSVSSFFVFAVMRITIVLMVHILCSAILGYYYGMAFFASPMLKIQYMKKGTHPVLSILKKFLHLKRHHIYHDEMLLIGLVFSMSLHAIYDFVLTIKYNIFNIPLAVPIMFIYFFGGFYILNKLFQNKRNNLKLGLVGTDIMPQKDFKLLLNQIQDIKENMKQEIISEIS